MLNSSSFVNIVNLMNDLVDPKSEQLSKVSEKGLYVREDDQDWGSAGMNNIQKDFE